MLITELFKHKHVQFEKKMQSKLNQYCAIIVQPHMAYCNVCKAVDGTHFGRNLIRSDLAHEDHNNIMTCLLYTSPSPRDLSTSRMPSSA